MIGLLLAAQDIVGGATDFANSVYGLIVVLVLVAAVLLIWGAVRDSKGAPMVIGSAVLIATFVYWIARNTTVLDPVWQATFDRFFT